MNWIQLFDIAWLTSLLVLLFLIWRSSERRRKEDKERDVKLINTLIEIARKDAESARQAVQAVQELIVLLKDEKDDVL
jgi:hypothetical protein